MKEIIQDIKDKMIQKNNIKKLILTYVLLFLGCELAMDTIYPLYIYNKTNNQYIAYYITAGGKYGSFYPDTLLPNSNIYIYIYRRIDPQKYFSTDSRRKWRDIFKELPKDTLSIFIFSSDTLNKYSWEEVRRDYKILKRYDLSHEDCVRLNFIVPYPPTPTMSRMKMYPKYGR